MRIVDPVLVLALCLLVVPCPKWTRNGPCVDPVQIHLDSELTANHQLQISDGGGPELVLLGDLREEDPHVLPSFEPFIFFKAYHLVSSLSPRF